jgi:hypothetical protein
MSDAMERLANFLQQNRAETVERPATGHSVLPHLEMALKRFG